MPHASKFVNVLTTSVSFVMIAAAAQPQLQKLGIHKGYGLQGGARASNASYQLIEVKIDGAVSVNPWEVTNGGIVSGIFDDAQGFVHSFIWRNGQSTTIDYPGAQFTAVGALTETGLLFGNWGTADVQHAGYLNLTTGAWTQLPDIPGYNLNFGSRLADSGLAVGYACNGTWFMQYGCTGWSWDKQQGYKLYSYPGSLMTVVNGVNNRDQEVGYYVMADGGPFPYAGFIRDRGALQPIIVPGPNGPVGATAYDINNSGEIVAAAQFDPDPFAFWPSFLLRNGSLTLLPDYPGVLRTFYQGLNNKGDLVGVWFNEDFILHGFVALRTAK